MLTGDHKFALGEVVRDIESIKIIFMGLINSKGVNLDHLEKAIDNLIELQKETHNALNVELKPDSAMIKLQDDARKNLGIKSDNTPHSVPTEVQVSKLKEDLKALEDELKQNSNKRIMAEIELAAKIISLEREINKLA